TNVPEANLGHEPRRQDHVRRREEADRKSFLRLRQSGKALSALRDDSEEDHDLGPDQRVLPQVSAEESASMKPPSLGAVDLSQEMPDKHAYEKALSELQLRLLRLQQRDYHEKRRAILVFEGWDAAGKGGAIRRLTEKIDPRGIHVW